MSGPQPPFVEFGFYFGASSVDDMCRVVEGLVELGGRITGAYSHSSTDSEEAFGGPTDYVQHPTSIATVEDLMSSPTRIVSVRIGGLINSRPSEESNLTFGRIVLAQSQEADHPILLWLSGDEVNLAINRGRRSQEYEAMSSLFDALVDRLDPFYGAIGVAESIRTPHGYRSDDRCGLVRCYLSRRILVDPAQRFPEASHRSTSAGHILFSPTPLHASGAKSALAEFGKLVGSEVPKHLEVQRWLE